ncbi:MAG: hypothetical protein A2931_01970 [Candidatus Niyogibacteria bacterium RIFCSPLOWO2_01_FULL_45_48]|uniref:DUF4878 domain-containing protein n=2 Tax=Candidatus Niyogiibacteriota TaxID=1817912 RepID=A0A1G2EZI0_9BACT|nr:MAG: hypothetical protein A2835_01730 [Candidatus Niyogibacteria bacterium RIFCSPHIGHO2_01_FULL_45_28]OGZ30662.1 MAG: hypothetical protein A2931_01970 [Candidatus Niyogibacteria bacterium RIFCSPLOWO2_01_FULL_45_48]OGZ31256.1 MAG: hypothetical protein A3J00_01790 [Candidatus Niyogibacteria bacterium RIFCSPLOWO2_02_FULL_45_13]
MVNRTSLKFVAGFALIIVLVFGSIYYLNYYNSPEQKALRYYADLEKQYAEDTYGGKTPEETLQLFIDALKAGDIDLASKYFVVEEREKTKNDLATVQNNGGLGDVMGRIQNLSLSKTDNDKAWFVITDENRVIKYEVLLSKNQNSVWKIIDM